jgi:defect in organelle trafficking protein DotC
MQKTNYKLRALIFLTPFFFGLTACATKPEPQYETVGNLNSLEQLQDLHAKPIPESKKKNMSAIRSEAIKDIAMSVGAQAGLAWRSKAINATLEKNARYLDQVFNFNLMLLNHNVVPPVLVQANRSLNLADPQTLRVDDRFYKIICQAHFTTVPPVWRNYLSMSYQAPEKPLPAFLPKTVEESVVWKKYATLGWQEGISQANAIFNENLSRLKRDYNGMALYRALLLKGMVSRPFVAHTNLGVTGDSSDLHINDQIYRITALPQLQPNAKKWRPVVTDDRNTSTS